MAKRDLPTPEELRQLLRYEPETGNLFWLERPEALFQNGKQTAKHNCRAWNAKLAGKEAMTTTNKGYHQGTIFKRMIKAHRAIWAIHYGHWPRGEIDHIDGDTKNNKIDNLREVSRTENMRNVSRRRDNSSGATGVYWDVRGQYWYAQIKVAGKAIHLGQFDDMGDARQARRVAELELGFHANHGR